MRDNEKFNLTAFAFIALFLFFFIIIPSSVSADSAQSPAYPPEASFSCNVTKGCAPLSVKFTDLSKNATGWFWDFGDKSASTKKNPIHTYTKPGIYNIALTVNNAGYLTYTVKKITVL